MLDAHFDDDAGQVLPGLALPLRSASTLLFFFLPPRYVLVLTICASAQSIQVEPKNFFGQDMSFLPSPSIPLPKIPIFGGGDDSPAYFDIVYLVSCSLSLHSTIDSQD